jgi:dinuclear metal center YbgI/SA1388 family protein
MDVTETLVQEAIRLDAELIITHHPFIFHGLKRIDYTGPQGRALCLLMQHKINVIGAHTNWDKAPGGVSDALAEKLELTDIAPLDDFARMGLLPRPMTAAELKAHIAAKLDMEPRMYCASEKTIRKVAVAGGSYGEGAGAAYEQGAEKFVFNPRALESIKGAQGFSTGALLHALEKVGEANKRKKFNANPTMLIEWLLFQILEGKFKWKKL